MITTTPQDHFNKCIIWKLSWYFLFDLVHIFPKHYRGLLIDQQRHLYKYNKVDTFSDATWSDIYFFLKHICAVRWPIVTVYTTLVFNSANSKPLHRDYKQKIVLVAPYNRWKRSRTNLRDIYSVWCVITRLIIIDWHKWVVYLIFIVLRIESFTINSTMRGKMKIKQKE